MCIAFCSCQGSISARSCREKEERGWIPSISAFPRGDSRSEDFGSLVLSSCSCTLRTRQRTRFVITICTLFPKYIRDIVLAKLRSRENDALRRENAGYFSLLKVSLLLSRSARTKLLSTRIIVRRSGDKERFKTRRE